MKYRFAENFTFQNWEGKEIISFQEGEEIEIIDRTNKDPHNYRGKIHVSCGKLVVIPENRPNWLVKAKNGITVWTTIDELIDRNILVGI